MDALSTSPSLVDRVFDVFDRFAPPREAHAHCDIPCGIYDPHMAQIAALTVCRMVQLIQGLQAPAQGAGKEEWDTYMMQISRYTAVKEEHAKLCEHEIVILWTDYFKPEHLEKHRDLHDVVWKAAKLTSTVKQQINMDAAQQLLAATQQIAEIFWDTKGVKTRRQASNQGPVGGELVYPTTYFPGGDPDEVRGAPVRPGARLDSLAVAEAPEFAVGTLEFDAVRELLARHTSFSAGRELALGLLPTGELNEARRRQAATAEALKLPGLRPGLHLGGVHDVRPLAERARVGGVLGPEELLDVASTIRAARAWRRGLGPLQDETPTLLEIAEAYLGDHPGLAEDIQDAIGEGGEVLDSASPALGRIRSELRGAHDRLVSRLREIMSAPPFRDIVQDPVVTQRGGRYVIPIRAESRGQVAAIVHDQSASGATLFVEPVAVVEMANRWRTLLLDEQREVERILRALSQEVGEQADALFSSVDGLAQIDLARASAGLAEQQRAHPPELVGLPRPPGQPVLKLANARHPLLTGTVVPISLELGDEFDILLITGPNTGGKTVALKTAGLLSLMAQAGLFVPADEGSLVAVFARIQADIGDEQSLQQSLSTFSSHVSRIVRMLGEADSCSLILLDELGAGTDPQEGAAIARALLDFLRERASYVVATTHYPELKSYAEATPRVQNASVEFDIQTLSPTYRLMIGMPGRSNALAIAERLGMPRVVLEAARTYVSPQAREAEQLLDEIARERALAEDARARAMKEAAEAATMKVRARAALRDAEKKHREVWQQAQESAEAELAELRREAQRLRLQLQAARQQRAPVESAREAVEQALTLSSIQAPPPPLAPEPEPEVAEGATIELGAEVLVPRLGLPGRVLAIRDGTVEIEVMGRRVRMPVEELEGATRPTSAQRRSVEPERLAPVAVASPRGDVPYQLDLRGLRRDEALERLEQYLEDASLVGLPEARIVHGKGTGAIRQAVRDTLRRSAYVSRFAPEPDASGGDGATQIWLK